MANWQYMAIRQQPSIRRMLKKENPFMKETRTAAEEIRWSDELPCTEVGGSLHRCACVVFLAEISLRLKLSQQFVKVNT